MTVCSRLFSRALVVNNMVHDTRESNNSEAMDSIRCSAHDLHERETQQTIELEETPQRHTTNHQQPPYLDGWRLYAVTTGLMLSCICSGLVRISV
jgi:hypothetical protein